MSRSLVLVSFCVLLFLSTRGYGQETPKLELFGGYSYMRADDASNGANMNGWNASVTGNANRWLGVTIDLSGHYRSINDLPYASSTVNTHIMAVGPRIASRGAGRITPFGHALLGVGRSGFSTRTLSGSFDGVHYSVLGILGGGVDIRVGGRLGFRLIQGDYIMTRFAGRLEHQFRLSTGLVFGAGEVR